ncbi:hypothetical protein [Paenibacillus apiarius]|uniref:hypothetical protein n=1 Tax=Paenibacillus apiarius TaxID=46240 RepID=UPI00198176BC|nr:hypothetical protein [Paenibacillus apiarius]MBN3526221.1 hypothetical protein [Paenibacillus apiarius]
MFKDRRFLIGLGAGIIIGGLLLQLILLGQKYEVPLTEQELRGAAERAGLELVPRNKPVDEVTEQGQREPANKDKK